MTSVPPVPSYNLSPVEKELIAEVFGQFLGPMPVNLFLQKFLPRRPSRPLRRNAFEKAMDLCAKGSPKYTITRRLARTATQLLPSLVVGSGSERLDPACRLSVDIGVYPSGFGCKAAPDLCQMELFFNVESDTALDPFNDEPEPTATPLEHPFETRKPPALATKARLLQIVGALSTLQSRTHTFSILVFGGYARLMRWDAAGVIVTERFKYLKTEWLLEFLWRFDALPPSQRGQDSSISRLDVDWPIDLAPADVLTKLKNHNPTHPHGHNRHRFFCLMKIPDRDNPSLKHDFVISFPPRYSPESPLGRGTRPLFAYDLTSQRLVFTKQYWRIVNRGPKEGGIYVLLRSKEVRCLPTFGHGNDVRDYATVTQTFAEPRVRRRWGHATRDIVSYRLYRMSLDTIGRPLSKFGSTRELVSAVRDAAVCHDDAFFKAGILHGDISPNNIMINSADGSGFLIDWDSCIDVNADKFPRRRGTWQFMSAQLLPLSTAPVHHGLCDDRESFLWVLIWMTLLHTAYTCPTPIDTWLSVFDERFPGIDGPATGGYRKRDYINSFGNTYPRDPECLTSPVLGSLITLLKNILRIRYEIPPLNPGSWFSQALADAGLSNGDPVQEYERYQRTLANATAQGSIVDAFNIALDHTADGAWSEVDDPALTDIRRRPESNIDGNDANRKRKAKDPALLDDDTPKRQRVAREQHSTTQKLRDSHLRPPRHTIVTDTQVPGGALRRRRGKGCS